MASYKYRNIITIQAEQARPFQTIAGQGLPKTTYRDELDAVHAVSHARNQHRMPAGTTIRIERIRVAMERIDPRDAAAGLRARNPRMVSHGLWMRYRLYEVSESGIVRRTDR